jgi:hypothetical protein
LPRASSSTRRLEVRLSDRLPVRLHLRHIRSRAGHRRGTQAAEGLKDTRQDSTERHEGGKYHRSSCNSSRVDWPGSSAPRRRAHTLRRL